MLWTIKTTDTFTKTLKKLKNHHELLDALEKKLQRLQEDPVSVGGMLSGSLHGKQSTRLVRKFRLIFQIDTEKKVVYLLAIDHREIAYGQ